MCPPRLDPLDIRAVRFFATPGSVLIAMPVRTGQFNPAFFGSSTAASFGWEEVKFPAAYPALQRAVLQDAFSHLPDGRSLEGGTMPFSLM